MKKIFVCFVVLFCSLSIANAQSIRKLEHNAMVNVLPSKTFGMGVEYSIGCNIDDVFFVGGGLGVGTWFDEKEAYYTDYWLPIFIQVRSTFLNGRKIRPYLSLSAGYDLASHGLIVNPNAGIAVKATSSTRLYIGVGYNAYNIEYDLDESRLEGILSAHIGIAF